MRDAGTGVVIRLARVSFGPLRIGIWRRGMSER